MTALTVDVVQGEIAAGGAEAAGAGGCSGHAGQRHQRLQSRRRFSEAGRLICAARCRPHGCAPEPPLTGQGARELRFQCLGPADAQWAA